jgi:hypothetical protein
MSKEKFEIVALQLQIPDICFEEKHTTSFNSQADLMQLLSSAKFDC